MTVTNKIKEKGIEILGKGCKYFYEVDPFNPQNTVEGLIGVKNDHRYGALYITSINGYPTEQVIHATPKLKYPFDRVGRYLFPSAQNIKAYTKYDGTNVFMYQYTVGGQLFTTYKVRLRPFIVNGRFGDFLNMWKLVLKRYPNIPKLFQNNAHIDGYSFELYGSLNKHLIEYDVALEPALLFGVYGEGEVVSLIGISHTEVPSATLEEVIDKDYVWKYQSTQKEIDKGLEETATGFKGQEGQVWYLLDKTGIYHMFKLKPETIENIHWASGGIQKLAIKATAYNVLETESELEIKALEELLLEEFTKEQIAASSYRIQSVVDEVNVELLFRDRVIKALDTIVRPGTKENKIPTVPDLMRGLSPHFDKREMSAVYSYTVAILEGRIGKEKVDELKNS